jgi:hypothetical protein
MPALDKCHFQVVRALQKTGWTVSEKPRYVLDEETDTFIFIDVDATQGTNGAVVHRIYVEVKCFPGHNASQELYIAFGQYLIYRTLLARQAISIPFYLAVPQTAYETIFSALVHETIRENRIKLIIVDLETETVQQWIE